VSVSAYWLHVVVYLPLGGAGILDPFIVSRVLNWEPRMGDSCVAPVYFFPHVKFTWILGFDSTTICFVSSDRSARELGSSIFICTWA
jgi:hypothetical protein